MTIYLDLDGVFANFEKRFKEECGFEYHVNPQLAWSVLEKVDNLFLTLEPMFYAQEMFEDIMEIVGPRRVEILTALPQLTGKLITAAADKEAWVRKYLSPTIKVNCSSGWRAKKYYCTKDDILVDDMFRNCLDWRNSLGIAILHEKPVTTIRQLSSILNSR